MIKFINKDNALEIQNLKKWLLSKKVVAIDSETRSTTDFNNIHTTEMIMFQIGDKETQWVIDTRDINIILLKHYLESKNLLKIGHNIKYDYKVLLNYNITLENVWDTMVVEQVLTNSGNREKGYYSLEQTHYRYYDVNPYGDQLSLFDPYIPKSERNKISKKEEEPFEESEIYYGATDIITCYKIYDKQSSIIELEDMYELAELENEFTLVLGDCEYNGIPLNKERWVELAEWTNAKQSELLTELNNAYPDVKNWNSHVQVKDLFKSLGMNITKSIKGEIKDSIQTIHLVKYIEDYPILKIYLKYKEFAKLSSTYGLSFLRNINPITNRIHSNFIQILGIRDFSQKWL